MCPQDCQQRRAPAAILDPGRRHDIQLIERVRAVYVHRMIDQRPHLRHETNGLRKFGVEIERRLVRREWT